MRNLVQHQEIEVARGMHVAEKEAIDESNVAKRWLVVSLAVVIMIHLGWLTRLLLGICSLACAVRRGRPLGRLFLQGLVDIVPLRFLIYSAAIQLLGALVPAIGVRTANVRHLQPLTFTFHSNVLLRYL